MHASLRFAAAALLLVFGAIVAPGAARAATHQCDTCSDEDFYVVAQDWFYTIKVEPLYIVNLQRGVVWKFAYFNNMTPDFDPEQDLFQEWVQPVPVEADVAQAITALRGITMEAAAGRPHIVAPIGGTYPLDANDAMLRESYAQNMLLELEGTVSGTIFGRFADRASAVLTPYYRADALRLPQVVRFHDGSSLVVQFDRALQQWVIQPGSARDSNNNRIPMTPQELHDGGIREFTFEPFVPNDPDGQGATNHDDYMDLLRRLQHYQVPISVVGQGGSSLTRVAVTCSPSGCVVQFVIY